MQKDSAERPTLKCKRILPRDPHWNAKGFCRETHTKMQKDSAERPTLKCKRILPRDPHKNAKGFCRETHTKMQKASTERPTQKYKRVRPRDPHYYSNYTIKGIYLEESFIWSARYFYLYISEYTMHIISDHHECERLPNREWYVLDIGYK